MGGVYNQKEEEGRGERGEREGVTLGTLEPRMCWLSS